MAEINLERKSSTSGVAAAVALLVLVLAVWWIMRPDGAGDPLTAGRDSGAGETAFATASGTIAGEDVPPAVATYLAWSDETRANSAMRLDHQYTVTGIRNLASALEAIAAPQQGARVADELRILRSRADTLQQNPTANQHSDRARAMFRSLAGLMTAMQRERFPELAADVQAVERAAEAVVADRPLLEQPAEVNEFFDRAGEALRRMAGRR